MAVVMGRKRVRACAFAFQKSFSYTSARECTRAHSFASYHRRQSRVTSHFVGHHKNKLRRAEKVVLIFQGILYRFLFPTKKNPSPILPPSAPVLLPSQSSSSSFYLLPPFLLPRLPDAYRKVEKGRREGKRNCTLEFPFKLIEISGRGRREREEGTRYTRISSLSLLFATKRGREGREGRKWQRDSEPTRKQKEEEQEKKPHYPSLVVGGDFADCLKQYRDAVALEPSSKTGESLTGRISCCLRASPGELVSTPPPFPSLPPSLCMGWTAAGQATEAMPNKKSLPLYTTLHHHPLPKISPLRVRRAGRFWVSCRSRPQKDKGGKEPAAFFFRV